MPQVQHRVQLIEHTPNPELVIAKAAKLCYSGSSIDQLFDKIEETDQSAFINKLMNFHHLTPIEHVSFTFGIEGVSRSLLAQITRHRLASFSVQSQRYVNLGGNDLAKDFSDIMGTDIAENPGALLQLSPEVLLSSQIFNYVVPPRIKALGKRAMLEYQCQMAQMQIWYMYWYYKMGATKDVQEDARFVLPNACETKIIVTMNARELKHFFGHRTCTRAQWEIQALATDMVELIKPIAPTLCKKDGPNCVQLGHCPEGAMGCGKMVEMKEKFLS